MCSGLPLISVVVTVYNLEEYIQKCLSTVLGQTYRNLEIIVVNDGSTDGSAEVISSVAKDDDRVIQINKSNAGVSQARKDGALQAKGDFILFVDGDDYLETEAVEFLYNSIVETSSDIAICALIRTKNTYRSVINSSETKCLEGLGFARGLLKHEYFSSFVGNLYRKELLQKISHYDELHLWEDFVMNLQIALQEPKVCITGKPLYHYIQRHGSLNRSRDSYDYLVRFSEIVDSMLDTHSRAKTELEKEILEDKLHWYIIYIKKHRNKWVGNQPYAKSVYSSVIENEKYLAAQIGADMVASVKLYRRRIYRPFVLSMATVRRLSRSISRRIDYRRYLYHSKRQLKQIFK